jgi:hypothetical protein
LTRQSAILSFYTIRPIRQLCLSPTLWNPLRHLEPIFTLRPFCNSAIICWTLPHVLSAHVAPRPVPAAAPPAAASRGFVEIPNWNATRHKLNSRHAVFYIQ